MFAIKIEMENWDVGEVNKKTSDAFKVWDELEYETKNDEKYWMKIIEKKKEQNNQKKNGSWQQEDPKVKMIWFALSYAKDLRSWQGDTANMEKLLSQADSMFAWMLLQLDFLKKLEKDVVQSATKQSEPITDSQVKYLHGLWNEIAIDSWIPMDECDKIRRQFMKDKFGVETSKDMTKEQASKFIEDLKSSDSELKKLLIGSKKKADDDWLPF